MRLRRARSLVLAVSLLAIGAAPARGIVGDCTGDGAVRISEIVTAVAIALGRLPLSRCTAADADGNGTVSIDELIRTVAAALAPPPSPTATLAPPSPSPTPPFQVIDLGIAGGQPCNFTQATFTIPGELAVAVNALRIEMCTDAGAFDIEAVTCTSFSATVAFDALERRAECTLDAPQPAGQVTVRAHGTGGANGDAFEPFDAIECRFPVFPDTAGGDYALRFLVVADTEQGTVANAGEGVITVFGLPDSGRFQGQCCNADAQCESGFCRGGDAATYPACCESDCAGDVCNSAFFAGSCCAASGLPDVCLPP